MSEDCTIALQLGNSARLHLKKKKKGGRGRVFLNLPRFFFCLMGEEFHFGKMENFQRWVVM